MTILGITLLAVDLRFFFLNKFPAAPSSDFGNYLTMVHIIQGNDVTGYGLRYPPLYFVLLAPLIKAVGPMMALKVLQAVVASSSCIPMFLLVERRAGFPSATAVTILFTFSSTMAEMTAWGGSPNFLAITFFLFVIYFLDRSYSGRSDYAADALLAGVFGGLVFLTHHMSFAILLAVLAAFFLIELVVSDRSGRIKALRVLGWFSISGVAVSLPGLSTYLRMQDLLSSSLGSYGPADFRSLAGPGGFGYLVGPFILAWGAIYLLSSLSVAQVFWRAREPKDFRILLAATALGPLLLGGLVVREAPGRVLSFLSIPLLIGLGLFFARFRDWVDEIDIKPYKTLRRHLRTVIFALFAADVLIISAAGVQWMNAAVDWYHPIEDGDVQALDWVKHNTASDSVFATSGEYLSGHKEGDRLGWWLEGYAERRTVMAGSERFRLFEDELQYARDMNRFFTGTHVLENGYLQVADQYPLGYRGNPEIDARSNGIYEPVLFLNDALNPITYYPDPNSTTTKISTLTNASRTGFDVIMEGSTLTTTARFSTNAFNVTRTVTLVDKQRSVLVAFDVVPTGAARISSMDINLWCPHSNTFESVSTGPLESTVVVAGPWREPMATTVSAGLAPGDTSSMRNYSLNATWYLPLLTLTVGTTSGAIHVSVQVTAEKAELDPLATLQYYNGYQILAKYHVDYLFESATMGLEVERFEKDRAHFKTVFKGSRDVIFQVLPGT